MKTVLTFGLVGLILWPVGFFFGGRVIAVGFIVSTLATLCTTVYLHRYATHEAMWLHSGVKSIFKFFLWITTGVDIAQWVAVHRKHHSKSDDEGDPHSPYVEGFWQIQLFNVYYYVRAARDRQMVKKFAPDILNAQTWTDKHVPGWTGPLLGTVILCLVFGLWFGWVPGLKFGLTVAVLHVFFYVFVLLPLVNGLCHSPHWFGYQRYVGRKQSDTVFNDWFVALLTCGEGNHHNHHYSPKSAQLGHKWWEVDLGWYLIRLLEELRLAAQVHRPEVTA